MDKNRELKQTIIYDDKALRKIAGEAATSVPGVLGPGGGLGSMTDTLETMEDVDIGRGVTVQVENGRVDVQALITVVENANMIEVMAASEDAVRKALAAYTDLMVGDIQIEIVDTETPMEYAKRFMEE